MRSREIERLPRVFAPALEALDLDPQGWERSIDRLVEAQTWPILVGLAVWTKRPEDRGVARAFELLKGPWGLKDKPWALALRGRCRLYLLDSRAREDLAAAMKLAPELAQARLWLVEALMRDRKTFGKAARLAEGLAAEHPQSPWALAARAACRSLDGRVGDALADLERAVELDPRRPLIRVLRCEFLNAALRAREAVAEAELAARLLPRSPWANLLWARAIFNGGGDKKRAVKIVEKALALNPTSVEGRVMLAEALRRRGLFKEALREYAKIDGEGLRYPRMNAWRGSLLRQTGRLREALVDLDRAVALSPEYSLAFVERAHARLRLRRFAGAFADMRAAARLDSKHGWIFPRPGEGDSFDEVAALLREAARRMPRSPWPAAWLGDCFIRRGRVEEAVKCFNDALSIDGTCAWALAWRGEAAAGAGRREEALADLERAVKLDPEYARARGRLGIALGEAGRLGAGLKELDAALRLDPRCAWALGHRGELKLLLGRARDAVADLDQAINQHRDYADAFLWRGVARDLSGGGGAEDIERAVALGKDRAAIASWLERAKARCGLAAEGR